MTASSAKMLQIQWRWCKNYAHKERFEVQNAVNIVEIAASRFKILQIARKVDRTVNPKNIP